MKHMSKLFIIFTGLCFSFAPALAFVNSTHGLVILSEYGESENINHTLHQSQQSTSNAPSGIGAATSLLINCLYQEVPVLAPASLWNVIVEHKKIFTTALTGPQNFIKLYGHSKRFGNPQAARTFCEQCSYMNKLYTYTQQYIEKSKTITELKNALWQDPAFNYANAPKSIHNASKHKSLEIGLYLICAKLSLDNYIVKEISLPGKQHLPFYLFFPKKLVPQTENYKTINKVSIVEQETGLKLDHFPDVIDPWTVTRGARFDEAYPRQLIHILDSLLVKNSENPAINKPQWCFYIMGHGIYCDAAKDELKKVRSKHAQLSSITHKNWQINTALKTCEKHLESLQDENRVCGIFIDEFIEILKKFDTGNTAGITTKLLFFSSCSAGGKQLLDIFNAENKSLNLSYTILADTLVEAPSLTFEPTLGLGFFKNGQTCLPIDINKFIDWPNKKIILNTDYDFTTFFDTSKKDWQILNINKTIHALTPVHPLINSEKPSCSCNLAPNDINNLPSIRLPHAQEFLTINPMGTFISITNSTSNKEVIRIPETIELVTLHTSHIPELEFTRHDKESQLPCIISMIPGTAAHSIKSIKALDYTFTDILKSCFVCRGLETPKLIHIGMITCKSDAQTPVHTKYHDVWIFSGASVKQPTTATSRTHKKYSGVLYKDSISKHTYNSMLWSYRKPFETKYMKSLIKKQSSDTTRNKLHSNSLAIIKQLGRVFAQCNTYESIAEDQQTLVSLEDVSHRLSNSTTRYN